MDRDRLQEVRAADMSESRVNEDFVQWLRTKGVWWATGIILAVAVYFFIMGQRQRADQSRSEAWSALATAALPEALEDVARDYADVDGIATLARIRAASTMLDAVRRGRPVGAAALSGLDPEAAQETLSDEERTRYLDEAARLFEQVVLADDGTLATALSTHNALCGIAAVHEARGAVDAAAEHFERAAARVEDTYPVLATQARARAATASLYADEVELPDQQTANTVRRAVSPRTTVRVNPALEPYLPGGPDEDEAAAGDDDA